MDSRVQCELLVKDALTKLEEHIDAELERSNDLETIRKERIKAMKAEAEQHKNWIAKDHGTYNEIDEKQFFEICKKSVDVVIHFYKNSSEICEVFNHHLSALAKQHIETRFIKINAEKAPFLTKRLGIRTIPTILLSKDNNTVGKLIGLSKLGNAIDFQTDLLEWRLAQFGVIRYDGDLSVPPESQKKVKINRIGKKSGIREKEDDSSDDEFIN